MTDLINFVKTHIDELAAIFGAAVALASLVVKLTPTTKDDELLGKLVKLLDHLSIVNPKK